MCGGGWALPRDPPVTMPNFPSSTRVILDVNERNGGIKKIELIEERNFLLFNLSSLI